MLGLAGTAGFKGIVLGMLKESLDSRSLTNILVLAVMIINGIVSLTLFVEDYFACFCPASRQAR